MIFVADFSSLAQELFLCLKLFTSDSVSQCEYGIQKWKYLSGYLARSLLRLCIFSEGFARVWPKVLEKVFFLLDSPYILSNFT